MLVLLSAVLTASLVGSMHCVGMCGPLAIFASGAGESTPRRQVITSTVLYHLGRLTTYMIAGLIAGAVGSIVDAGGRTLGFQLTAARVVGTIMVLIGVYKISESSLQRLREAKPIRPSAIGGLLVKLRPFVFRLNPSARALVVGLLTTLLPCGWLYLFALIAAGTGSMVTGPVVMFAFWLGTVPALTTLISGTFALSGKFKTVTPVLTASLLVIAGLFTASGRGFADIRALDEIQRASEFASMSDGRVEIDQLIETPLPCCEATAKRSTGEATEDTENSEEGRGRTPRE